MPRDAADAHTLFRAGMRAMEARDEKIAFRIFSRLCRYAGHAPPDLIRAAGAARDYLDPSRSPREKAETLFGFFSPTFSTHHDADSDDPELHSGSIVGPLGDALDL